MKKFLGMVVASTLLLLAVQDGSAANPPGVGGKTAEKTDGAKTEKKGRGLPFHGHIAAVDKAARTITMRGEKQRKFYVTSETKIKRDQRQSAFASIMVGEYVGGYAREAADGKLELVTLNVGAPAASKAENKSDKAGK